MREKALEAHKALLLQKRGNTRTWAGPGGQHALCPVTQGAGSQRTDPSSAGAGHCGERRHGRGYSNRDDWRTRVARAAPRHYPHSSSPRPEQGEDCAGAKTRAPRGGGRLLRHRKFPPNGPGPRLRSGEGAGLLPLGARCHRARAEDPRPRCARKWLPGRPLRTIEQGAAARGSRARFPRAARTEWRPEGGWKAEGGAARAEAARKVTSGLGARPPDPRV